MTCGAPTFLSSLQSGGFDLHVLMLLIALPFTTFSGRCCALLLWWNQAHAAHYTVSRGSSVCFIQPSEHVEELLDTVWMWSPTFHDLLVGLTEHTQPQQSFGSLVCLSSSRKD